MKNTVFDAPVINVILRWFSLAYFKVFGWKYEGTVPEHKKYVVIAAPHTSNWDFPITMFIAFIFRVKVYWMGKETIFKRPFGTIMRWLGGIPIDRSKSNNVVDQIVDLFNRNEKMVIIIPPEGTREKVNYWKTGFYHIANGANVPIVMSFVDYARKAGGIGPTIIPNGDIEMDMYKIHSFFATITAKYPEKSSLAAIHPDRFRKTGS